MHLLNEVAGISHRAVSTVGVQVLVADNGLVDGQHQQTPTKRCADGGEARRRDLLEDRHHEAERAPFLARLRREVVSIEEVFRQGVVKPPLVLGQVKRLRVNLPAAEQRFTVRVAGIGLSPAKHYRVEAVAVFYHVLRVLEQAWIEKTNEHPETKVIPLVRSGG